MNIYLIYMNIMSLLLIYQIEPGAQSCSSFFFLCHDPCRKMQFNGELEQDIVKLCKIPEFE